MPVPKGVRIGGRQKGTLNKKVQDLHDRAKAIGVDPLDVLFMIAAGDAASLKETSPITLEQRMRAASECVQYLYAKRKATELSGPDGEPVEQIIQAAQEFKNMDKTQLIAIVEEELAKLRG